MRNNSTCWIYAYGRILPHILTGCRGSYVGSCNNITLGLGAFPKEPLLGLASSGTPLLATLHCSSVIPYINRDHEENGLMLVFASSHNLKYETKEAICLAGKGNPCREGAELDKTWPSIFKLLFRDHNASTSINHFG